MAGPPTEDTLSAPLLRMARFFFGEALPQVRGAPDVYAHGRELHRRRVPILASEAALLTKVLWCLLQVQHDREESDLHQALLHMAALVLAIIEDDDFSIPDGLDVPGRQQLELLALRLKEQQYQLDMSLGVAIGMYDLSLASSQDLDAIAGRIPPHLAAELRPVITKLKVHLGQGEAIFAGHGDPARRERHAARLKRAYGRASFLLARLLAVAPAADHPVLRANIVRREHKHIEVDALGAEVLSEAEQTQRTRQLLAWTEEELGESLTDENKAALAARLKVVAAEQRPDESSGDWLADME